jgi:Spy/CpxP family protein refolding chaperone
MQNPSAMWGMLLRLEKVQTALALTDDQKAKLKDLAPLAGGGGRPNIRDMTDEERQEFRKKAVARVAEQKKAIKGILQPGQIERLKGIALQLWGAQGLQDKEVQDSLQLTDEQKAKLKAIAEDTAKKVRELFAGGGDRAANLPKMQAIRKDALDQATAVLADAQKATFEKLKGEKVDISFADLMGGRRNRAGGEKKAN